MASNDWFEKDFYAVLGVPPESRSEVIKAACPCSAKFCEKS